MINFRHLSHMLLQCQPSCMDGPRVYGLYKMSQITSKRRQNAVIDDNIKLNATPM